MKENKEIKAREVLSYLLFEEASEGDSIQSVSDVWRDNEDVRERYRKRADKMLSSMEKKGVRISVSSVRKVDRFLHILTYIPARVAYVLTPTEDNLCHTDQDNTQQS